MSNMTTNVKSNVLARGESRKRIPSADELHRLLAYNTETGILTWKPRLLEDFPSAKHFQSWRAATANPEAGRGVIDKFGEKMYKQLCINGTKYLAHRVIWTMFRGEIPDGFWVDHASRDIWDNRIENLRLCDIAQSNWNKRRQKNRKLDLPKGVGQVSKGFTAQIHFRGVRKYLGFFKTPDEASAAYEKAAREMRGEFTCLE